MSSRAVLSERRQHASLFERRNRPYVVAIIDEPTGAIVFLGHLADPTSTQ
jgi:serine protease inhibitor